MKNPKLFSTVPRCSAIVDLLSRVQRPFLWSVTVWAQPPHGHVRRYEITANSEREAAQDGIDRFVREFSPVLSIIHALDR